MFNFEVAQIYEIFILDLVTFMRILTLKVKLKLKSLKSLDLL